MCPGGVPRAAKAAAIPGPRCTPTPASSGRLCSAGPTSVSAAFPLAPRRLGSPSACQPGGSARLKPSLESTYRLTGEEVAVALGVGEAPGGVVSAARPVHAASTSTPSSGRLTSAGLNQCGVAIGRLLSGIWLDTPIYSRRHVTPALLSPHPHHRRPCWNVAVAALFCRERQPAILPGQRAV